MSWSKAIVGRMRTGLARRRGPAPEGSARRGRGVRNRLWPLVLALVGLGALATLMSWAGAGDVARTLAQAGWLVIPLAAFHIGSLTLDAAAWRVLTPPPQPDLLVFLAARWVREGVNALLPAAQLGGEVVAVRLLARAGAGAAKSSALVGIDLATEFLAMTVVGCLGAAALVELAPAAEQAQAILIAAAMVPAAVAAVAVLLLQHIGLLGRLANRIAPRWPKAAGQLRAAQDAATAAWDRPGALLRATALHCLGWGAGAFETWIVLKALAHPLRLEQAFALETTSEVLRSFGFAVPGLLAVQEGSLVLVGGVLGLTATEAIALSLFRRARDISLGVPALLIWQAMKGRRPRRDDEPGNKIHSGRSMGSFGCWRMDHVERSGQQ